MSNMSPQSASFNRGIWRKIEKQFRDWSYKYGELVIVTGPVLNGDYIGSIGPNQGHYSKVVLQGSLRPY